MKKGRKKEGKIKWKAVDSTKSERSCFVVLLLVLYYLFLTPLSFCVKAAGWEGQSSADKSALAVAKSLFVGLFLRRDSNSKQNVTVFAICCGETTLSLCFPLLSPLFLIYIYLYLYLSLVSLFILFILFILFTILQEGSSRAARRA